MSLKAFHIVFIAVSAALALFMVLWGWNEYRFAGGTVALGVGVVGLITLMTLIPYFRWIQKKFRGLSAVIVALLTAAALAPITSAQACSVCFGDPNSLMTKGIKAGIIFLVLIIGGVLGGIVTIGISWSRRAKALGPLT